MTATYSHPTHPGHAKLAAAAQAQGSNVLKIPLEESERDPHALPSFELEEHKSPVLYLPPPLSSLPERVAHHDVPANDSAYLTTETRLPDIDPASLSLHKALHHFHPITPDYTEVPYADAFNWSELELPEDEEREWYCVVFRSKRKPGSDGNSLYEADKLAHEEAVQNGGLIMYWYGIPNERTGVNMATCIWQSRKHASAANSRPHHIKAMRLAAQSYETYELQRHVLRKVKGEKGVTLDQWSGGDVGW